MKPQARAPQPPQFQHQPIDLEKVRVFLGLLFAVTVLVLWIVLDSWWVLIVGIGGSFLAGGIALLLRRSLRARGLLRRVPGVKRAGAALRRLPSGRIARSRFGRAASRATRRVFGRAPGQPARPRGALARMRAARAALPTWAGGTRGRRPAGRPNTPGGSPAGGGLRQRARAAIARMTPGGRRQAAAGAPGGSLSGRRPRTPGGGSTGGRATNSATRKPAGGQAGRQAPSASKTHGRPSTSARPGGGQGAAGSVAETARKKAGGFGRLVGELTDAITEPEVGMTKDGYSVTKVRGTRHLTRPGTGPSWPEVDQDEVKPVPPPPVKTALDPEWPTEDPDEDPPSPAPRRSLPAERDHDPPPSPPASPPSHRETPRITSTNTKHGGTMRSVDSYVQMIDNSTPVSIAKTCSEAADEARRDAARKEEDAKKLRFEAGTFDGFAYADASMKATAQKLRSQAEDAEQDARNRLTWAARLDGMARDATAKLAS